MAPTATYHRQKTTPAGIVFLVRSHVLGKVVDPGRQDGNLHFWCPRVTIFLPIIPDQLLFSLFRDRHLFCVISWPQQTTLTVCAGISNNQFIPTKLPFIQ